MNDTLLKVAMKWKFDLCTFRMGVIDLIMNNSSMQGQIKNIVNMFSHCSSKNGLFLQKKFHGR